VPGCNSAFLAHSTEFRRQQGEITGPLNRGYGTGTARQTQFMFRVNF
jgi:hypothetical protein